ncbi:uncharacterized protein MYCGRDRAFT_95642 [Zymoseptoria tritici IPO323]|uniref:Uncharacterized protein n=1 Tax=Zymoseptoria tritici (strain CBS 115943 / IPO323) TaxID=336722 RepID=F9XJI0_ZYMTI|nr:uncharacterized protein MYCGRDRAFT_95642 [Zymoseptoria tritici IPO323]EGP84326.1 hypothetical protein MYCGRDRAFT_95642 [Zymoseptoria tritici IPO323]
MSAAKKAQQAKMAQALAIAALVQAPASPMKTKLDHEERGKRSTAYRIGPSRVSKNSSPKGKGKLKKGTLQKSPMQKSPPKQKRSTGKSKGSNVNNPCDFLALHPDVRKIIYKYVLAGSTHADLEPAGIQRPSHLSNGYTIPAILKVCSSVRLEAAQVWYPQMTFLYCHEKTLLDWLRLIGPANRAIVRTLRPDRILQSQRWAEAAVVFTHARIKDAGFEEIVEDAIEAAFWKKSPEVVGGSCEGKWAFIRGEKWAVDGAVAA